MLCHFISVDAAVTVTQRNIVTLQRSKADAKPPWIFITRNCSNVFACEDTGIKSVAALLFYDSRVFGSLCSGGDAGRPSSYFLWLVATHYSADVLATPFEKPPP